MYSVLRSEPLAERIHQLWISAPHVSHHAQAGQFVVIRIDEKGERIPLTISQIEGDLVRIIFMIVGKTTRDLASLRAGDMIRDVMGPLGKPSEMVRGGTCVLVGGGVGAAGLPLIAHAARAAGNKVIGIIGARTASLLILEDELRELCDTLYITTDDGTRGSHGFASDALRKVIENEKIDAVWIIGPAMMMRVTAEVTRPAMIKTFVSLNPIMVDGTGMCGSCRVTVGGETRFACVDGPEFDAHSVDFDNLILRLRMYTAEEKQSLDRSREHPCFCKGDRDHE